MKVILKLVNQIGLDSDKRGEGDVFTGMTQMSIFATVIRLRLSAANIEALHTEPLPWCEIRAGLLDVCPQRVGVPRDQVALDLAVSAKAAERVRDDASGKTSSTPC